MSYFNSLTNQERFNLHQAGIDQDIIDDLDKEDIQYSHKYIQELVKGTLISKNAYDKKTRWVRLNIINEHEPVFLDLEKLNIQTKKQLIGYCNNVQFAKMKYGRLLQYNGEFEYTHETKARMIQEILYLGHGIINNDIYNDLTIISKTFKIDALELDIILYYV